MLERLKLLLRRLWPVVTEEEREIRKELLFHLDRLTEAFHAQGMSRREARRAALRRFGKVGHIEQEVCEARGLQELNYKGDGTMKGLLNDFWQDIRYGMRMLRRNPGFTAVAVLTLALGIGANTAIFSLLYNVLLRPLPVADLDTLSLVRSRNLTQNISRSPVSLPDFTDWREQNQVFTGMSLLTGISYNLAGGNDPVHVVANRVSSEYFDVLGVHPQLGRGFLLQEEQPGEGKVVILSYSLWQRNFGADPNIIGKTAKLDGEPYTVIGVMPEEFWFPERSVQLWTPLTIDLSWSEREQRVYTVLARQKPGVTRAQAQAELNTVAGRLAQEYPATNENWTVRVTALLDWQTADKLALAFLMGAVGFVLLIACANVANLLLARSTARQREFAIRAALGAGRLRLVRQLLTENFTLALLGGVFGFLLARWGVLLLEWASQGTTPFFENIPVDWQMFSYTLLLTLGSSFFFGLLPALQGSNPNLHNAFKEAGRNPSGAGRHRLRALLAVSEISLAFILVFAAGVLMASLFALRTVDRGYVTDNVLTFSLSLPDAKYPHDNQVAAFYANVVEKIQTLPGVEEVAAVNRLPSTGGSLTPSRQLVIEGRKMLRDQEKPMAMEQVVSPDYFDTFGIALLRGRDLSHQDATEAPAIAVISETMAHQYWPNEEPLGQRFKFGTEDSDNPWTTIVGMASDVSNDDIDQPPRSIVYLPHAQKPLRAMSLAVRTTSEPLSFISAVRQQVQSLDSEQPIFNVKTMRQLVYEDLAGPHVFSGSLAVFACIALLLASVGIYGVISYSVEQRTHEFGIRMAIGAQPGDILKLVLWQGSVLTLLGLAIGLLGAIALAQIMASILFGVIATSPTNFAAVTLLLLFVALLACYVPARRATKVDPMVALRYE